MKTLIKVLAVVSSAVAFFSCERNISPCYKAEEITFTANQAENNNPTRTILGDGGTILWHPAEEISVFAKGTYGWNNSKFISQNTEPARTAKFMGTIEGLDLSTYSFGFWAVYPYDIYNRIEDDSVWVTFPSIQATSPDSFGHGFYPTLAHTTTSELTFYAIGGGILFSVNRPDIHSVSIKGNKGETLAGKVLVAFGSDGKPQVMKIANNEKVVTLSTPDGSPFLPGEHYIISLLPVELTKGFTAYFYSDTEKGVFVSNKPQTVKRATLGAIDNFDMYVTEWESTTNPMPEPEAIDLGLSVKWASFNLGASKPEEYGDYYAWGETKPHYEPGCAQDGYPIWRFGYNYGYNVYNYKWREPNYDNDRDYLKYNGDQSCGIVDHKSILDIEDDAANVNLGGNWRMPTIKEIEELCNNCTYEWTQLNGVSGCLITSNIEGFTNNSIFLPYAGTRSITSTEYRNQYGYYWSSSLNYNSFEPRRAYYLFVGSGYRPYAESFSRYQGRTIRPVYSEYIPVSSISLSESSLVLNCNGTQDPVQLTAIIYPENATSKDVRWTLNKQFAIELDETGKVTPKNKGAATVTAYTSNGLSASCAVTVILTPSEP